MAGTWTLTRFALRRDRLVLPVWILIIVVSAVSSAQATIGLYPSEGSRIEAVAGVNDVPALVAFYGRIWDPSSLGALSMMKMSALGAALVGVFAIMLVVRHTRREEENGRLELVGAGVVGRAAPLMAALLVVTAALAMIAVLSALGLTAVGLPAGGSWAFGLAWFATGMSFAGVAAITAQVSVSARAAVGWAVAVVGIAYALRALGDISGSPEASGFLSWLSPIGWGQQVRAFAGDRWWVLAIPFAFTAVTCSAAFVLRARRDLGAGLLPDRDGPAHAGPRLSTPLGLAWRLNRSSLLAWTIGFAAVGAFLGAISNDLGPFLSSEQARDFIARLGGSDVMTDAFLALEFGFMAVATAAYAVSGTMRLHSEEESGHVEAILATAVSRPRWMLSHLVVVLLGTSVLCLILGLASGVVIAGQTGQWGRLGESVAAAVVYLPAVWVVAGIVVLIFGLIPAWTPLAWAVLVGFLLLGEFGSLFRLPTWVIDLSPFSHVPRLPSASVSWLPLVVLVGIAGVLVAAGILAFRRRDLVTV